MKTISFLLVLVLCLHVATWEAIKRAQERTECYKTAKRVDDCPRPATWELMLRNIFRTEGGR